MIFNKFLPLLCLLLLNQGAFIWAQSEIIPCTEPNPSPDNLCTMEYRPVCAYRYVCVGEQNCDQGVTVGNACGACSQEGFDFYTDGACPGDEEENVGGNEENEDGIIWCATDDSEVGNVCTLEYAPVCAYNADEEGAPGVTVGNACQACFQQGFDYFTQGACSDDEGSGEEEGRTNEEDDQLWWCDPLEEITVCTLEYAPVCAWSEGQSPTTIGNACQACAQGFDVYTQGEC